MPWDGKKEDAFEREKNVQTLQFVSIFIFSFGHIISHRLYFFVVFPDCSVILLSIRLLRHRSNGFYRIYASNSHHISLAFLPFFSSHVTMTWQKSAERPRKIAHTVKKWCLWMRVRHKTALWRKLAWFICLAFVTQK